MTNDQLAGITMERWADDRDRAKRGERLNNGLIPARQRLADTTEAVVAASRFFHRACSQPEVRLYALWEALGLRLAERDAAKDEVARLERELRG